MKITQTQIDNIPDDLKRLHQWVCHRNKVPFTPHTGNAASSSDPTTWGTFYEAINAAPQYDGIGFVFSKNDPYIGVDIDHCIDETDSLSVDAKNIANTIKSYTEKSQSGKGIHILCKASLPIGARRNTSNGVEMYAENRYFVITGNRISSKSTIMDRQNEVNAMYYQYVVKNDKQNRFQCSKPLSSNTVNFNSIIESIPQKQKEKFKALWTGEIARYSDDDSAADLALCNILAYQTKSPEQTDTLFRQSALYRDKWDEVHCTDGRTYGQITIAKAFQDMGVYAVTPWFDDKGRFIGVCKIVCASVLSHRESSKMGKRGRGSKWQIKIVSDSSVRNSFGA